MSSFQTPKLAYGEHGFTYNKGGWSSQNVYPRQVADVNGDGRADIVAFGDGATYVAYGQSDGTFKTGFQTSAFSRTAGYSSFDRNPRLVADVNGDRRADIVGFHDNGVYVALSNGGTFQTPKLAYSVFTYNKGGWSGQNVYPRQVADVNGDGRADIVGFGEWATYVAYGQSDGTFKTGFETRNFSRTAGYSSFDRNPRLVADVNGDRRADIVGFHDNGVYVALSNGGTFQTPKLAYSVFTYNKGGWSGQNVYPRQVADVNGDGRADIVGFGEWATYVAYGQSDGTFKTGFETRDFSRTAGYSSFDRNPRLVADVNGDGRADIVGFHDNGVYVGLANGSNNPPPNNPEKSFENLLNALGARESGKPTGDPLQYVAINWLHFVGKYQFGEALLKDLGYYDPNSQDPNYWTTNNQALDWRASWSGKDGVTKLGVTTSTLPAISSSTGYYPTQTFDSSSFLGNVTAQENAIRSAFALNLNRMISQIKIEDYLGLQRSYQQKDGTTKQLNITMSGILAGAHLRGGNAVIAYLLDPNLRNTNPDLYFDENRTSITEYMDQFGGYDTTFGTKNSDTITGTKYNDVLVGFGGNDTLTGGAGEDRFRFYSRNDGLDTITDFNSALGDKLEFHKNNFGLDWWVGNGQFVLGTSASNASNRLIYNSANGALFFDPDGNGSQSQVQIAKLTSGTNLTANDIVVF
ncbi:hypothetical protein A2T98_16390 [Nodularia spumigena CENA596]|uniref:Hemolysin n=1 Tax=Nodularia spumigena CENA596 TaxID=1819295 RepID=A0A161VPA1_NODSP|nr:FG-GAP-like repeat-containing protein [Nodularia spumigena]KZL48755.1 hypothetical protein A2T98_16390 [Nodularia spumigena CENA596]